MHTNDKPRALFARRLITTLVVDVLTAGVILCVFSLFHHVLPAMRASAVAPVSTTQPSPTPEPTPEPTTQPAEDDRTPWQIKFAEHFTDEVVLTENSYTSPEVSITVSSYTADWGNGTVVYHVADIYVARLENFMTSLASDAFVPYATQDIVDMGKRYDAILSINGDFSVNQSNCLCIRNGIVYCTDPAYCDICLMHYDGRIECLAAGSYNMKELVKQDIYQAWHFGPALLDGQGKAIGRYTVADVHVKTHNLNPRCGLGYFEPGHYAFVVIDGRQDGYSVGATVPQLANVFIELGCMDAYNLDGGRSAMMVFNGVQCGQPSNGGGRDLGDILLIRDSAAVSKEDGE